jgi:DNA polymerase III subunit beta
MTASHAEAPSSPSPDLAEPLMFTMDRATLADAVATAGMVVARSAIPGYAGVLLEGRGDHLIVSATDGLSHIVVRITDVDAGRGRVLVSHTELAQLLTAMVKGHRKRELDGLPVTVNAADPDRPVIDLDGYSVPITALPMDRVEPVPDTLPVVAQLDRAQFVAETLRVLRAVKDDPILPMLAGVKLDITDGGVTVAGTDRFRLSVAHVPAVTVATETTAGGAVLPGALLRKFLKRLPGDRLRIGWQRPEGTTPAGDPPPLVSLASGPVTLITAAVDGQFPKYSELLPKESNGWAVIDRAWLRAETQRAAAVLAAKNESGQQVSIVLDPLQVRIAPVLSERGEEVATPGRIADIEGIDEPLEYLFNPVYLLAALESFTGERITLHPTGGVHRPLLLTDKPQDGLNPRVFRHLLMPVRHPGE